MSGLVPKYAQQQKREKSIALLGQDLKDVREETFCRMVCDGLGLGLAFKNAGFTSCDNNAPTNLWNLDRVQQRANAILEARATQGAVTLPEVTDMLHRVFVGAWHKEEFSAAHNAAFSLARLYGHVTDKSTVEVIRRPSRDPDAPSEQALSSWVNSLPIIEHEPVEAVADRDGQNAGLAALPGAPADLLGTPADNLAPVAVSSPPAASLLLPTAGAIADKPNDIKGLEAEARYLRVNDAMDISANASHSHLDWCGKSNDFNELDDCSRSVQAGGRPENGAPTAAVTGTPSNGARAPLLAESTPATGGSGKGAPRQNRQVPVPENGEYPPIEDLF
jgi:hypothetical protein